MSDWRPICECCEQRPVQEDDVLCAECRAVTEIHSSVITDPLELLLGKHLPLPLPSGAVLCLCHQTFTGPVYHRRHVAELVYSLLGLPEPKPHVPTLIALAEDDQGGVTP